MTQESDVTIHNCPNPECRGECYMSKDFSVAYRQVCCTKCGYLGPRSIDTVKVPLAARQAQAIRLHNLLCRPESSRGPTDRAAEAVPAWKEALIEYRRELQTDLANLEEHHPNNESVAQAMRAKLNAVQECFARIHAAHPSAPNAGWQPIATAPKTGEHILVAEFNPDRTGFGFCGGKKQSMMTVAHWWDNPGEEGWYASVDSQGEYPFPATHWKPLNEL